MKLTRKLQFITLPILAAVLAGCATQSPQVETTDTEYTKEEQLKAQKQQEVITQPTLKRKVALGRITNETIYGKSLLRDSNGDVLGKQVTDILSKSLTESGAYLVFERPDISRLQDEAELTGNKTDFVGVDTLIIGSLTEFGRKTVGESGFMSSTKKQVAFAKVDLRLVDVKTGLVYHSLSGAGESSTESASVAGFGSKASYDGTLNDAAISNAVSDAINKLTSEMQTRPWSTDILAVEDGLVYVSGGKSQGISQGMKFAVETKGKDVKSEQTGFTITLPGKKIAELEIVQTFGDSEANEGSSGNIVDGSLDGVKFTDLVIKELK